MKVAVGLPAKALVEAVKVTPEGNVGLKVGVRSPTPPAPTGRVRATAVPTVQLWFANDVGLNVIAVAVTTIVNVRSTVVPSASSAV